MMGKKICCIFNAAPHYRKSIYNLMSERLGCHFYFGKAPVGTKGIKSIPDDELPPHSVFFDNCAVIIPPFYRQKGVLKLLFQPYDIYLMTGEPYCLTTWLFLFLHLFSRKKIIFWTHGWYGDESFAKIVLKKIFFGLADHILTYGNYAKKLMVEHGFRPDKISVIYNSLDYTSALKIRESLQPGSIYTDHFGCQAPVICFSGRLSPVKKLDLLLQIIARFKAQGRRLHCILLGDGESRQPLLELAAELGIADQVWFYGACYEEVKIAEIIFNADLCVIPDNAGLSVLHAMSYGCPVITHDYFPAQGPEFEIIKDGVNGSFYRFGDDEALKEKVQLWCFEQPLTREQIRENCCASVAGEWNSDYQEQVLEEVVSRI